MAKSNYKYASSVLKLKGFDDLIEALQEAGKDVDKEGKKCFDMACNNLHEELVKKSEQAKLDQKLINKIREEKIVVANKGAWYYEVGWKKTKPTKNGEIPDTYKVLFYNYGAPRRKVKQGGQRVMIDGKWVTLGTDRGEIPSKNFIRRAKQAAATRNRKLYRSFLDDVLGGLK